MMSGLPIKLGIKQQWFLYVVGSVLTLSGALWVYFHYFVRIEGEFGPIHHPSEPVMLTAHGLSAALMMIGFGTVMPGHIARAWKMNRNMWTGIIFFTLMILLSLSGYFLYYLSDESLREITSMLHWILGLVFPLVAGIHVWRGFVSRRR